MKTKVPCILGWSTDLTLVFISKFEKPTLSVHKIVASELTVQEEAQISSEKGTMK